MLHNAMYNGIVMLWPPIQMLILACHTGAGMCDEPRRTSAWEASDAVEYLIKVLFICRKGDHIPLSEITKLNVKSVKTRNLTVIMIK